MVTFYTAIEKLFNLIEFLIVVRIFMSFLRINPNNPIGKIVYELTEPVLAPARFILSKIGLDTGMFDFSPIVAMFILSLLRNIIYRIG